MRILVTGGGGFLGSNLAHRLSAMGAEVVILDSAIRDRRNSNSKIQWIEGDYTNPDAVGPALRGIDTVYHLAWTSIPATSNQDPVFDVSSNLIGSIRLFEACVSNGVSRVVFSSTGGTVYGDAPLGPITETAPTNPQCSYGITKLAVEKYLGLFAHLKKLNYVALRISNAYGPHQDPKSRVGFIGAALAAAENKEVLSIWGDGTVVRDYVFVDDIVQAMVMSCEPAFPNGIYHVSSGIGIALNSLVSIISSLIGSPLKVKYTARRDFDVKRVVLDNSQLRLLGWSPKVNLNGGIRRTWEWMKINAGKPRTASK